MTRTATGPHAEPYPRFSDDEMARRRRALEAVMTEHGVSHLVLYGANRNGSAVGWLTRWPVTREALVVMTPGRRDTLLVNFYNHVPNAERIATEADVRWAGSAFRSGIDELDHRGGQGKRVGVIGPVDAAGHAALAGVASDVVDLNHAYTGLRLTKSAEELEWIRVGAELTDRAVGALHRADVVGRDERQLGDLVERAYIARGGTTHIHYFGVTSMADPGVAVPAQWPSTRPVAAGDVITCEISASFWDHPGQLLRTFTVGCDPTPLYRDLHDAAQAAFDRITARLRPGTTAAEVVDAASVIEDAGFTTRDDLVHGFVGGYLPPVLGSKSRTLAPIPDFTFEAGMTFVIQPNVVTPDERAGVQTGELVVVEPDGARSLHDYERGLLRIDGNGGGVE